jgi:hypothetical protein
MGKSLRKCPQEKCFFNRIGMGCRVCQVCKAKPHIIDDNCDKCWNCAYDEGVLRWEDEENTETEQEADTKKVENKPIEVRM